MGSGIAQLCASKGFRTVVWDIAGENLSKASAALDHQLAHLKNSGKISSADAEGTRSNITFSDSFHDCNSDLIIEAIVEDPKVKKELFTRLRDNIDDNAIITSNTSSLSINELSACIDKPERFAGLHFFNPPVLMKLVEIVAGDATNEHTCNLLREFAAALKKQAIVCRDSPGFVVNRVARPFYLEALKMVEDSGLSYETVDALIESTGFKMGPFRLMDLIGNDVNYAVSRSVYEAMGKPARLQPSEVQARMVQNGQLGRKSGTGYYNYNSIS
jgi:3-hydroxybutyryl-CoA dehydrogenase